MPLADRGRLEEPPEPGRVYAGARVVQAVGLGIDAQPRIGERARGARACAIGQIPALGQGPVLESSVARTDP